MLPSSELCCRRRARDLLRCDSSSVTACFGKAAVAADCAAGVLHLNEEERGARQRRPDFTADDVLEACCDATARASPPASARLPSPRIAPPASSISTRRSAGRVNVVLASPPTTCSMRLLEQHRLLRQRFCRRALRHRHPSSRRGGVRGAMTPFELRRQRCPLVELIPGKWVGLLCHKHTYR